MTTPQPDTQPSQSDELAERLIALLRASPRPLGPEELASAVGERENTVRRALGHLVKHRRVRRAGGGLFAAASARIHR